MSTRIQATALASAVLAAALALSLAAGLTPAQPATPSHHSPRPAGASPAVAALMHRHCWWNTQASQRLTTPAQRATGVVEVLDLRELTALAGLVTTRTQQNVTTALPSACIPSLKLRDGPAGLVGRLANPLAFPAPIALAATFDAHLAAAQGVAMGTQARAADIDALQAPTANLAVFANWGRTFESLGASPFEAGTLAAGLITGIQRTGVVAVLKHLGPYAAETNRNQLDYVVSPRVLAAYLTPFALALRAHPGALMCAVGSTNATPTCADPVLARFATVHGFAGFVRTDLGALSNARTIGVLAQLLKPSPSNLAALVAVIPRLHRALVTSDLRLLTALFAEHLLGARSQHSNSPSSPRTIASSIALESPVLLKDAAHVLPLRPGHPVALFSALPQTLTGGGSSSVHLVKPVSLAAALTRTLGPHLVASTVLRARFTSAQLGPVRTGRDGFSQETVTLSAPGRYALDILAAQAFEVDRGTTPLLRVDSPTRSLKRWPFDLSFEARAHTTLHITWFGPHRPRLLIAPLTPVLARARDLAEQARSRAATCIVQASTKETEGIDRSSLALPGYQDTLVATVASACAHTVVVLDTGGPVLAPWRHRVQALVEGWYAGAQANPALARLLTGRTDFSGRLPYTWPAGPAPMIPSPPIASRLETINLDAPLGIVGQSWYQAHHTAPLYPFGYGLSYAHFTLTRPVVVARRGKVVVHLVVVNQSSTIGTDVLTVYATQRGQPDDPGSLVAFTRVRLAGRREAPVVVALARSRLEAMTRGTIVLTVTDGRTTSSAPVPTG